MAINNRVTTINSALYNVAGNDEVIMVNTSRPTTVILPSDDANKYEKRVLYIKDYFGKAKTNPITVVSAGGKTIDGASFISLNKSYAHLQVVYDGTNWNTMSQLGTSANKKKLKDYFNLFK